MLSCIEAPLRHRLLPTARAKRRGPVRPWPALRRTWTGRRGRCDQTRLGWRPAVIPSGASAVSPAHGRVRSWSAARTPRERSPSGHGKRRAPRGIGGTRRPCCSDGRGCGGQGLHVEDMTLREQHPVHLATRLSGSGLSGWRKRAEVSRSAGRRDGSMPDAWVTQSRGRVRRGCAGSRVTVAVGASRAWASSSESSAARRRRVVLTSRSW